MYLALFNINEAAHEVAVVFAAIKLKGRITVRDLWKKTNAGEFRKKYVQQINPQGLVMLRLTIK